ncbi:MAG: DUF5995 family protein [Polyangiales bacterium]
MDPLLDVLPEQPVSTIPDVLAVMAKVEAVLPRADGIACFNRLYRKTTENILARIESGGFSDPTGLARLDIVFANKYFLGVRACLEQRDGAPRAWYPLVEARADRDIAPIQFALAGMNAHINRDLAVSLVDTFRPIGAWPQKESPARADYDRVNDVLASTETEVKSFFEGELLAEIDRDLGSVDDRVALWSVRRARDAAWTWGETLFALDHHPVLASETLLAIDRTAGLASRALLL